MKVRNGFVSNSSSSSFICQVCGEEVSGLDMSLRESEMFNCVNGHTVCENHIIGGENKVTALNKEVEDGDTLRYITPEEYCPICSFHNIIDSDIALYLMSKLNTNRELVLEEVKRRYSSYKAFKKEMIGK